MEKHCCKTHIKHRKPTVFSFNSGLSPIDDLNGTTNGNHTYIVNGDTGDDTCHMRKMSGSKLIVNMGIKNQSSPTPLITKDKE